MLDNVREQSAYTIARLDEFDAEYDFIGEVRGLGLMLGMEMIDPATGAADSALALRIQRGLLERGLIARARRTRRLRRAAAAVRSTSRGETLDQALDVMEATFAAVRAPMTARVA